MMTTYMYVYIYYIYTMYRLYIHVSRAIGSTTPTFTINGWYKAETYEWCIVALPTLYYMYIYIYMYMYILYDDYVYISYATPC